MAICYRGGGFRKPTLEESSRSAEVIAFNDDLLTELLLRLPVKSLLKFKCVCKHWLSLITDPHFVYCKNLKSNTVSALYLDCYSPDDGEEHYGIVAVDPSETWVRLEYLNFKNSPCSTKILQSCNGLFCCWNRVDKYFVYNPSTGHFKTLPPVSVEAERTVWGANLAFDPSKSRFYKVLCIIGSKFSVDDRFKIVIYSSKTGGWGVPGRPFTSHILVRNGTGVYCNGAIHWASKTDASLYFDMKKKDVGEMPPPLDDSTWSRYFGESGGHLYLVEQLTTHLNVYEMEIDRSGWLMKYRVDAEMLAEFTMPSERIYLLSVLFVARGEKEEDSFMVLYISNNKVIRYNFRSETHKDICEMDFRICVSPPAYQYIESLHLV